MVTRDVGEGREHTWDSELEEGVVRHRTMIWQKNLSKRKHKNVELGR